MSSPPPAPAEGRPSPKAPGAVSFLAIGLLSGIISGIVSGMVCAVICLLAIFVVLPSGKSMSTPDGSDTITEQGEVDVLIVGGTTKGEAEVFYRDPFATTPRLTILPGSDTDCVIKEQKADSFKLARDVTGRGSYVSISNVKWKAEGTPAP